MPFFYLMCKAISLGVIVGFVCGAFRLVHRPRYSEREIRDYEKLRRVLSAALKYVTLLALLLGLIWCSYFLVLGAVFPEQSGYATNLSQLIVSVLTVISIIFAFFEFISSKKS